MSSFSNSSSEATVSDSETKCFVCMARNIQLDKIVAMSDDSEATIYEEVNPSPGAFVCNPYEDEVTSVPATQHIYGSPKGTLIKYPDNRLKKIIRESEKEREFSSQPPIQHDCPLDVKRSPKGILIKYSDNEMIVNMWRGWEDAVSGKNINGASRYEQFEAKVASQALTHPPRGGEAPPQESMRGRNKRKRREEFRVVDRSEMKRDLSWLPEEWRILECERLSGIRVKYYEEPKTGILIRTQVDVRAYLNEESRTNCQEVKVGRNGNIGSDLPSDDS